MPTDSTPATASLAVDPYAPRPSFLEQHGARVAPVAVFFFTVLLTVISFPPSTVKEAAYAMLVPGAFWAYLRPKFKLFAWTMLGAQAVAWTILLAWLHNVTWLGLFLLGPFVGVWVGSWFLVAYWALPRMLGRPTLVRLAAMLGLAAAWVLIEWTRTWLLSGFPWLPLAASQWTMVSMLQVAAYTGALGISFVVVVVNLGFAAYAHRLFREKAQGLNKRSQEFFLALFIVLACFSLHVTEMAHRAAEPFARVAFVQPYIPQQLKWEESKAREILGVLAQQNASAAATRPELILWPEAATPWAVRGDENMKKFVEQLAQRAQAPILLGSIATENTGAANEQWLNAAFVVSPTKGLQADYYAKRHLVPFGEYVPLRSVLGWLHKIVPVGESDFSPGSGAAPLLVPARSGTLSLGVLICYEDVFPSLARSAAFADASALVVLTNNAWFGEGGAAHQHAAHSVLRAVETRRPVLRCGNGGWSGWIDEFGVIRAVLTQDADGRVQTQSGAKDATIYFRGTETVNVMHDKFWAERTTFYVEHGDWFVAVCAALALLGYALLRVTPPAEPKPAE